MREIIGELAGIQTHLALNNIDVYDEPDSTRILIRTASGGASLKIFPELLGVLRLGETYYFSIQENDYKVYKVTFDRGI